MIKKVNLNRIKNITKKTLLSLSTVLIANSFNIKKVDSLDSNVNCEHKIFINYDDNFCNLGNCVSDEQLKIFVDTYIFDEYMSNKIDTVIIMHNNFITDLSILKPIYSNIRRIVISNCSSIIDLTPIYYMDNLEEVYICENIGINKYLIDYLDNKDIKHNITNDDLNCVLEVKKIYQNIITNDMSSLDKIKAISIYLKSNFEYDLKYIDESNEYPMSCMINNKKGVCASYAYIANILFRMSGIESFMLENYNHVWNVINIDDKYYYVDVTCTNLNDSIELFEINNFGFGSYFMINPSSNKKTAMTDFNDSNNVLISNELYKKIENGEKRKNIFEKVNMVDFIDNTELFIAAYLFCMSFDNIYTIYNIIKRKKYFNSIDHNLKLDDYQKQLKYEYTNKR